MDVNGFLPRDRFDALLGALTGAGYRVLGPTLRDGAIVYSGLENSKELPSGIGIEAKPGSVRALESTSHRFFAWANGPQSLKPLLFKPEETLWQVEKNPQGELRFIATPDTAETLAVIGVRACDLAALDLHDRHFLHGAYRDQHYAARREQLLLIAVNCTHPAETCFCASTGDGPTAQSGYDLLLDELDEGFVIRSGTDRGRDIAAVLELKPVTHRQGDQVRAQGRHASQVQTRSIPAGDLYDALSSRPDHPRWMDVAERCLSCGNCTQVCPSCFCSREQDEAALEGAGSSHVRRWDSCFTEGHSYITGLVIRSQTQHRYRQWLTHKLGGWHRQYGRSGCVGCGRCIAWCPVGIDICEELAAVLGERNVD